MKLQLVILVLVLALGCNHSMAADRITAPRELIDAFYRAVFSDTPVAQLPDILTGAEAFAASLRLRAAGAYTSEQSAKAETWKYLRSVRKVFQFPIENQAEAANRVRLVYVFTAFEDPATFFHGRFAVELMAPVSMRGREGVLKQVRFRLEKNKRPEGPSYLIVVNSISINGVYLDPGGEHSRITELYELLGFELSDSPSGEETKEKPDADR